MADQHHTPYTVVNETWTNYGPLASQGVANGENGHAAPTMAARFPYTGYGVNGRRLDPFVQRQPQDGLGGQISGVATTVQDGEVSGAFVNEGASTYRHHPLPPPMSRAFPSGHINHAAAALPGQYTSPGSRREGKRPARAVPTFTSAAHGYAAPPPRPQSHLEMGYGQMGYPAGRLPVENQYGAATSAAPSFVSQVGLNGPGQYGSFPFPFPSSSSTATNRYGAVPAGPSPSNLQWEIPTPGQQGFLPSSYSSSSSFSSSSAAGYYVAAPADGTSSIQQVGFTVPGQHGFFPSSSSSAVSQHVVVPVADPPSQGRLTATSQNNFLAVGEGQGVAFLQQNLPTASSTTDQYAATFVADQFSSVQDESFEISLNSFLGEDQEETFVQLSGPAHPLKEAQGIAEPAAARPAGPPVGSTTTVLSVAEMVQEQVAQETKERAAAAEIRKAIPQLEARERAAVAAAKVAELEAAIRCGVISQAQLRELENWHALQNARGVPTFAEMEVGLQRARLNKLVRRLDVAKAALPVWSGKEPLPPVEQRMTRRVDVDQVRQEYLRRIGRRRYPRRAGGNGSDHEDDTEDEGVPINS